MCTCNFDYRYSSRNAASHTIHTAGGSDHRLGVHLLDTEKETKTKCEDQFKAKMHVLITKKLNIMQIVQKMTHRLGVIIDDQEKTLLANRSK